MASVASLPIGTSSPSTARARERSDRHLTKGHAAIFLIFRLQRAGEVLVGLVRHNIELVDSLVEHALSVLIDRQARPRPISWRFFITLLVSLSVQI